MKTLLQYQIVSYNNVSPDNYNQEDIPDLKFKDRSQFGLPPWRHIPPISTNFPYSMKQIH